MPYTILKTKDNKYQLKNKNTGVIVKRKFNSRATAKSAGNNYHKYKKKQSR
jgi:hypothetical protein